MRNHKVTKWGVVVGLLLTIAAMMCGCGGVVADARHSVLIDATAVAAADLSDRAAKADTCPDCVGEFTKAEVRKTLKTNATLWLYFSEAKSGGGTFPVDGLGE